MKQAGGALAATLLAGVTVLAFAGIAVGQDDADAVIAHGQEIYEETAGGVGCAVCHGVAATGDPDAGGPYIRGASKAQIDSALGGAVPVMEFIELNNREKVAVQAYLQYLTRAEEVMLDPVAAQGKKIFEETAGGVGCASCHGKDAAGGFGPSIHDRDPVAILNALRTVEDMAFIKLTDEEIAAVGAYLRYLHDTVAH